MPDREETSDIDTWIRAAAIQELSYFSSEVTTRI
jgi:hypothetical protein